MYKVLICGDRKWSSETAVRRVLSKIIDKHDDVLVIEGGASGADRISQIVAHEYNCHVAEVPALWNTRGRGAGPQRNQAMLALEPDEVIAFHKFIENSKGTADMIKRATKAGIKTRVVKR